MAVLQNPRNVIVAAPSSVFDPTASIDTTPTPEGDEPRMPDAVYVETASSSNFMAELEPGQTVLAWAQEVKDAGGYYDEEENRFYPWHAITSIVFRAHDHYTKGK